MPQGVSILQGLSDRELREAVAQDDARGRAILAALRRERQGNPPSPIGGFRYSNTTQLDGEMLECRRQQIEHIKVIDSGGPCGGWGGCLAQTPKGEILVLDAYGFLCRSADEGRNWTKPVRVDIPGGALNVFGALGALRDGTLLIGGMSGGSLFEQKDPNKLGSPIDGVVSRSTDNGQTWEEPFILDRLGYHLLEPASHIRFVELSDGTILLPLTGNTPRTVDHFFYPDGTAVPPSGSRVRDGFQDHDQWIFRSRDGGKTWGDPTLLAPWGSETNIVELPSGKLIAAIRYQREWAVEGDDPRVIEASQPAADPNFCTTIFIDTFIAESDDKGYTWSQPRKISRYLEHPADIVCTSRGTLVVIMGHKSFPQGPHAIWSHDEGRTWSDRFLMLHMDPKGAAGQPSAIVLEDDTIIVSYDRCAWCETDTKTERPATRYQLWVARFKLPADNS